MNTTFKMLYSSLLKKVMLGAHFGFPGCAGGKETAYNAGDLGLTLSWEDPLEKKMVTLSSILPEKSYEQRSLAGYSPWGHKRVRYDLLTEHTHIQGPILIFLIIRYVCVTTKKYRSIEIKLKNSPISVLTSHKHIKCKNHFTDQVIQLLFIEHLSRPRHV